jgi:hypothetical protein
VLVRLTEPSASNPTDTHALGFLPGLELSASAQPARIVSLSLAADASLAVARLFEPARQAARFQPSLSPSVQLHFKRFELELAFRAPLGGALGGSTFAGGLALRVH